jgi:ABC-type transporter Mla subunit MlaD
MAQAGDSAEALAAARRALATRDAELADADRALLDAVADVQAVAAESIGRLDTISADIETTATDQPKDSPAGAREVGRHLVTKNREIAAVVREANAVAEAKTIALKELIGRYRTTIH